MKALLIGSLCAAIGLAAAQSFAQDPAWRPATPFQRVAATTNSPVTLSRPVPIASSDATGLAPASAPERPMPLFRAKTIDDDAPRLMPVGPSAETARQPGIAKPMNTSEPLAMPRPIETSTPSDNPVIVTGRRRLFGSPLAPGSGGGDVVATPDGSVNDCICDIVCEPCETENCRWGLLRRWRDSCVCCEDPCCLPRPRGWIRGEYLLWSTNGQNLPPMLTGENAPIRSPDQAGVLPLSPTLLGGDSESDWRSGGRVSLGFWFPRHCNWGVDASLFMLGRRSSDVSAGSDANGNPVLARPFFQPAFQDIAAGEAAELISYPGLVAGSVRFESSTRLWGAEANLRRRWCCGPRYWVDGFIGYRHLQLADTLNITEDITNLQFTPGLDTRRFVVRDQFATRNMFNGGQVGLEGEVKLLRRWFLAGNVKVALGNVHQIVDIDGSTTFVDSPVGTVTGRGGLLALASNIGRFERNEFAVVPEFGIKIGLDINDHWRVYAGYNLLYVSSVVRAGDQIDRVVNFAGMGPEPTNLNPAVVQPARPAVLFRQSDFWAQGGQFGVEYHW
jgi:hypothetical protein